MKIKFMALSIILLIGAANFNITEAAATNENYKSLLDELQQKVDQADKRMIAHPKFLEELRGLIERYRAKLRTIFLSEDFSDGDFTKNPAWEVKSGRFRIDQDKRLRSEVHSRAPTATVEEKAPSTEKRIIGLLLKEMIEPEKKEEPQEKVSASDPGEAVIKTSCTIAPAFEVEITFLSGSEWGTMEIVLAGGSPETPRYRLVYQAAASENRPLEILRQRNGRTYTIESAVSYPNLDDNKPHRLQWIREVNGTMKVVVDGKEILKTVEVFYQDNFSSLSLVNRGGTYAWDSIRVMSPLTDE